MKNWLSILISVFSLGHTLNANASPRVVVKNEISLWTESFGQKTNPAILLVQGSGGQTVMWPQDFCEDLANQGFYVIRFDHRDAGLSASIDFEKNPYTFLHMANDTISILDDYKIQEAHFIGYSIGGLISALAATHYPDRVSSLTLLSSTLDMRANLDAFMERKTESLLPPPSDVFLAWGKSYMTHPPKTMEEKVAKFIEGARIQHGTLQEFDESWHKQLALQTQLRQRSADSMFNHVKAVELSHSLYTEAFNQLKIAPLILHGQMDPVLPPEHALAIKNALPHAKLVTIPDMGHGINKGKHKEVLKEIVSFLQDSQR